MNISVFIFCFNEEGSIADVIYRCIETLERLFTTYQLIVVDDGSTDNTGNIIKQICLAHPQLVYIKHPTNRGIGAALKAGYEACTLEYICAIPGDGQFDVNELAQVHSFDQSKFYSFYRSDKSYSAYRLFLTMANRVFNQVFLNIRLKDVNWIKVYRKDQIALAGIELNSSIVESELCAKLMKAGCRPIELKSCYHKRTYGEAKGGNWKTVSRVIREVIALLLVLRKFNKNINV